MARKKSAPLAILTFPRNAGDVPQFSRDGARSMPRGKHANRGSGDVLQFGRRRRRLATNDGEATTIWDIADKKSCSPDPALSWGSTSILCIHVAIWNFNNHRIPVTVWDVRTGQELRTIDDPSISSFSVSFSSDGTRLALPTRDDGATIWDVDTGREALHVRAPNKKIRSVTFSPAGRLLATNDLYRKNEVIALGHGQRARDGHAPRRRVWRAQRETANVQPRWEVDSGH